jgi:uncharacterized protein (DUF697 family)
LSHGMKTDDSNRAPASATVAEVGRARRLPTPAVTARARELVREHMLLSVASALVPEPILCTTAVAGVHLDLLIALSRLYDVPFSPKVGRVLLLAATSGALTYGVLAQPVVRRAIAALMPMIMPLWFVGGSILAGGFTHVLGHAFIRHYENGGTFEDFDWHRFRHEIAQKLGFPRPPARPIVAPAQSGPSATSTAG